MKHKQDLPFSNIRTQSIYHSRFFFSFFFGSWYQFYMEYDDKKMISDSKKKRKMEIGELADD